MKLNGYSAVLNNGIVLTEATRETTALNWDSLHWSNSSNRVEINRAELTDSIISTEDSRLNAICLKIRIRLALQSFTETMSFAEINPVEIRLDCEASSTILAWYYFKDWWTRPAFVSSFEEVPDETALLFFRSGDKYRFLIALPGKVFRAHFAGKASRPGEICLVLSADGSGYTEVSETAMLSVTDEDPYQCMKKGMAAAAQLYQIPTRDQRSYPEFLEKLGWCSWDAFYKEVTEDKLADKASEIAEKKLPFGWILIDDGWQDYTGEDCMSGYGTNPAKFPHGLKGAVNRIREICGINQIGVWHAFSGYWSGIDPEGPLARKTPERFIRSHQGKLLPRPETASAYHFYADWYDCLREQGISFVKVDSQSSTRQHYRTNTPTGKTCRALHQGLDQAVEKKLNGGLINCMGMAMENVLARPTSGVSRNSDDFFPLQEESFKEHLLENAYNALWHTVLYHGDWDMFWSNHPCAEKHALLRALSGGPVYVSDRVGESIPEVLMPLCYADGTLLRAPQSAVPTPDCLLTDPSECGYLKLQNICNHVGYLAVYSYTEENQTVRMEISDLTMLSEQNPCPDEEHGCAGNRKAAGQPVWAVYEPESRCGMIGDQKLTWDCNLEGEGFRFYQVAPVIDGTAVFGRADKELSSHAIAGLDGHTFTLKEAGPVIIYADHAVACTADGKTVTLQVLETENFYLLQLPVEQKNCRIEIW